MDIKNSEHYNDPTPHSAWKNICKEEQAEAARMKAIGTLVSVIKQMADLAGYEVVGRIVFMDKDSGRIYRLAPQSARCAVGTYQMPRTARSSALTARRNDRPSNLINPTSSTVSIIWNVVWLRLNAGSRKRNG